ncbi:Tob [Fasciolopsis buskii]|uniref:Tob n=1 Tax=Fasciolopsis buskii TaxID=27845 RepID=A0A8E0RSR8_9TREM|nr:Tob [Fasciolopsis buski]
MLVEVSIAVNYILSHLYTKLPRRRVDSFGEELERYMHAKYQQHWFPADPMRDSAYRCLNVGGPQVDLLLPEAAAVSGLDWSEIQACLPEGLVLSVDPGHVACQYHQPQFNMQEFNRYPGQLVWPSASVSLSSSGCSSASSSISSTNLTPTSNQITHQVLYCFQDSWFANNSNNNNNSNNGTSNVNKSQWNDINNGPVKTSRSDQEHGDSLATAAALSVLVDSEDNVTSNLPSDAVQKTTTDPGFNGSSLPINSSNVENVDLTHVLFREAEMKAVSSSGLDMLQLSDSRISTGTCLWPNPTSSTDAENNLITLMNGDLNLNLTTSSQMTAVSDKSRTQLPLLNRSSSNPPQTDPSNPSLFHDYSTLSAGNLSANSSHMGPTISKLDPNGNPVFSGPTPPRMSAIYNQSTLSQLVNPNGNNHFVQKSISTPSFTAATFAQTKFGSTKLKTHTKRTPNRILSPTTVPQAFSAYTGSSLIGRDSVNMTNVGPAQRLAHSTGLDLNPIQRLLPSAVDLNMNQNGKSIQTMDLPTPFDTSERTNGFGANHANLVRRKLFPIPGVANANKDAIQPNLFDGLFPSAAEESKTSEDFFSNLNFSEPTSNSNKFWYNTSAPVCRESSNPAATNFLSGPDWFSVSQSFNPVDLLSSQQASKAVPPHVAHSSNILDNSSTGKSEDSSDLPEESFLSARMVNLLLEDDSTLDPIKDTQVNTTTSLAGDSADVSAHGQTVSKPASVLESIITELGALKNTCTE